jgi:Flp pilus assembly protein TadD
VAAKRLFSSLHLFRARALLAQSKQEEAVAALDAFLAGGGAFDSEAAAAYGRRGALLRRVLVPKMTGPARRRALQLARAQLEKAVEGDVPNAMVYEDLGAVLEQLGQVAPAVVAYTEALKLVPDDAKVRVKRGWAYADLRPPQYDKAKDDFAQVVKQDPSHAEANAGLGYIQACRKAPAEARVAAGRALLHGAGDYLVLHNVACVYAKLAQTDGDHAAEYEDLAIENLRRAVELWRRGGTGPDEIKLIENEPTFHPDLRARPEFKQLLTPP